MTPARFAELPFEARLILEVLRTQVDSSSLSDVPDGIDWDLLFKVIKRNRLLPLFYRRADKRLLEGAATQVVERFSTTYQEICTYNDRNIDTLNHLLAILSDSEIDVVPFKGVIFAENIYGTRYLKEKCDIDLLVKPKDFLKALDILVRRGFDHEYFGHAQVSTKQAQLERKVDQMNVDLHYGLTPQYQLTHMDEATGGSSMQPQHWNARVADRTYWFFEYELDRVWERSQFVTIDDRKYRIMSDEDTFLVAFINGFKENWRFFVRFCDLAEIIVKRPRLDWQFVLTEVTELRARKKLALALRVVHEYLRCPLPEDIEAFVYKASDAYLARELVNRTLDGSQRGNREEFRRIVSLLTMDRLVDGWRYLNFVRRTPTGPFGHPVSKNGFLGFLLLAMKTNWRTRSSRPRRPS